MALSTNSRIDWVDDIEATGSEVDVVTVIVHELGHALGLGHSADPVAVMASGYTNPPQRDLASDDTEGIIFLYDSSVTGSVTGTVSDHDGPIDGATVVLDDTELTATTAADGTYTISDVPDPVTYTVIASMNGFSSVTLDRQVVTGAVENVNFLLTAAEEEEETLMVVCRHHITLLAAAAALALIFSGCSVIYVEGPGAELPAGPALEIIYVVGDFGVPSRGFRDVAESIALSLERDEAERRVSSTPWILELGDNLYPSGLPRPDVNDPRALRRLAGVSEQLTHCRYGSRQVPLFMVPGNHDYDGDVNLPPGLAGNPNETYDEWVTRCQAEAV